MITRLDKLNTKLFAVQTFFRHLDCEFPHICDSYRNDNWNNTKGITQFYTIKRTYIMNTDEFISPKIIIFDINELTFWLQLSSPVNLYYTHQPSHTGSEGEVSSLWTLVFWFQPFDVCFTLHNAQCYFTPDPKQFYFYIKHLLLKAFLNCTDFSFKIVFLHV